MDKINAMKNYINILLALFVLLAPLHSCTTPITTPTPEEPEGFVERVLGEVEFINAELEYMGDDMGEQLSDGWLLKLYTDMEIDPAGNPIGPGAVMQILLNVPYNASQEPDTSLLRGVYTAQNNSSEFSPGTFVNGYIHYIDLPGERLELPDATFWGDIAEGSTEMEIDLVDDGAVQISGNGDQFTIEGILVGNKCLKRKFLWSGTLEPKSYVEPEVPNSTLEDNLSLENLTKLAIQDRGDYFALRDESYRSLLLFLAEESIDFEWGKPIGSGKLLRIELLVPWDWDATQGVPEGTYPMLSRNLDTSIDRDSITPYHSIPGLPNCFSYPYWSGAWFVEFVQSEWSNNYARIDSGQVVVERSSDGSHHIICTLFDSSTTPLKVDADVRFDNYINL